MPNIVPFTIAFPELAIRDTRTLISILNDKRVHELRQLIDDAVAGKVQFDEKFAKSVLTELLHAERKVSKFRSILGYLTLPLGFIPVFGTPVQKVVEEAVGLSVEHKMKRKHQWFYMISDLVKSEENPQTWKNK